MSYAERHAVTVTTDASGNGTGYTPPLTGRLAEIAYVKTDFDNGVDFTITGETTERQLWREDNVNATTSRAPRTATHSTAGVAATFDGTYAVLDQIALANERVKIVVAQGGDTKTGTFYVIVG